MSRPSRRVRQFLPLPESRWQDATDNGADGIDWDTGDYQDPGSGSGISVAESDGMPSVSPVDTIILNATDFTVVDNADGSVTVTTDEPDAAAHVADATDAHDASAVSVLDTAGNFAGSDVEAVLAELAASTVALRWAPVTTFDGTNWLVAVDGSGNAIMTEV